MVVIFNSRSLSKCQVRSVFNSQAFIIQLSFIQMALVRIRTPFRVRWTLRPQPLIIQVLRRAESDIFIQRTTRHMRSIFWQRSFIPQE